VNAGVRRLWLQNPQSTCDSRDVGLRLQQCGWRMEIAANASHVWDVFSDRLLSLLEDDVRLLGAGTV
jgi:hypothetical protein